MKRFWVSREQIRKAHQELAQTPFDGFIFEVADQDALPVYSEIIRAVNEIEKAKKTEGKDFFYVKYVSQSGIPTAMVLPQHRLEGGAENPDGFNIANATLFLAQVHQTTCVIEFWEKISPRRAQEWFDMLAQMMKVPGESGAKANHLTLVPKPPG